MWMRAPDHMDTADTIADGGIRTCGPHNLVGGQDYLQNIPCRVGVHRS